LPQSLVEAILDFAVVVTDIYQLRQFLISMVVFSFFLHRQSDTYRQWRCQLWGTGARAPLDLQIWEPTIQVLCSLRDQLMQMSTTHSSFDQYCISHKTIISHRATAAPGSKSTVSAPW